MVEWFRKLKIDQKHHITKHHSMWSVEVEWSQSLSLSLSLSLWNLNQSNWIELWSGGHVITNISSHLIHIQSNKSSLSLCLCFFLILVSNWRPMCYVCATFLGQITSFSSLNCLHDLVVAMSMLQLFFTLNFFL